MTAADRALAQLRRPAAKREIGGHGDVRGFMMLIEQCPHADLSAVEFPQRIACSTCRFMTTEFHERMPCWDCVTDEALPKWRQRQ